MGWFRDDGQDWSYDHEGHIAAVVNEDGHWRDLGYPTDKEPRDLFGCMLQVVCTCGWRSQRQTVPLGASWSPYMVLFRGEDKAEAYEEAAMEVWDRHLAESGPDARHALMNRGFVLEREAWARRSLAIHPRWVGCIVCGGRLRTISEDGDQECTVSPDHGYDDLVPPPVLMSEHECDSLLRDNERLRNAIHRALNHPEAWRDVLEPIAREGSQDNR